MQKLHIGLIEQGGRDWAGGMELTKNLLAATFRYCEAYDKNVEFTIFGNPDKGVVSFGNETVRRIEKPQSESPPFFQHVTDWLNNKVPLKFLQTDPWSDWKQAFQFAGVDFVYPFPKSLGPGMPGSLMWIADFQHCHLPHYFSKEEVLNRNENYRLWGNAAQGLVFSSQDAQSDFQQFFPQGSTETHVMPFRIVLPDEVRSVDPKPVLQKYSLPKRYALTCGQFWAHKNHLLLLDAIASLREKYPDLVLVLTGRLNDQRNPGFVDEFFGRLNALGLNEHVRVLGLVPKVDQLNILRCADFVIQPSLFEGWSTTVEESHSFGKRQILSDLNVHTEQKPPHSIYFPRDSASHLSERIEEFWNQPQPWERDKENAAIQSYDRLVEAFGKRFYELALSHAKPT